MTQPRLTILVVDDDAGARILMRAALRKAGYEARLAVGGEDALRQFRAAPCDMVMLDVDMPDLDGHEVCAALREFAGPLLPIVMVTGMDDLRSVERAFDAGATDFIAKPVNWGLIGHRLRYLFRSHGAMRDLQAAEARHAAVLNAIPDLLFELDIDGRYIDYRAPRADLLAAPADVFLGKTVAEILPPAAAAVCMAALYTALEHGASAGTQFELPLAKGSTWFELSVSRKTVTAGEKPRFIALSRDITERKIAEARIARLAYFDSLTGLPNRQSFLDRVDREIRRAEQRADKLAVLFMDLDGFKNVNDTMGHSAGDLLLQWAAERLREGLRPSDVLSRPLDLGDDDPVELARLGGDEFTALILDIDRPDDAIAVAQRIGQLMRRPFVLDEREVTLTTSIGIALYPEDGRDAATLLKHADTAMYHAKSSGRDNAQLYSSSLTAEVQSRMELDASLRAALERQEFHLVYQPQIDVASGRVLSLEALLRWRHPTRGMIAPLDFVALAEQNGSIGRIGEWVLHTACAEAAHWQSPGHPVSVAVNLSPLQFKDEGLVAVVLDALARSGLAPSLLELEITEGAVMENTDAVIRTLNTFRARGVHIALDDFGTGYSSLSYLSRMPVTNLKVDRSFVNGLPDGGEDTAIVRAILAMSASMGIRVTAEGVETLQQVRMLLAMGCDCLQGYYFSGPVAAGAVPGLLQQRWQLDALRAGHSSTPGAPALQVATGTR
jgi:diguanylate cyclase (GGDEF)-like protein/PAS domain S-box-containing protein